MDIILRRFYEDKGTRDTVRAFQTELLKEMAVEKVFAGEDVSGMQEALMLVEKTFDRLDEIYGKIKSTEPETSR